MPFRFQLVFSLHSHVVCLLLGIQWFAFFKKRLWNRLRPAANSKRIVRISRKCAARLTRENETKQALAHIWLDGPPPRQPAKILQVPVFIVFFANLPTQPTTYILVGDSIPFLARLAIWPWPNAPLAICAGEFLVCRCMRNPMAAGLASWLGLGTCGWKGFAIIRKQQGRLGLCAMVGQVWWHWRFRTPRSPRCPPSWA